MTTIKCRWQTFGGGTWHTTLDSDVSGVFIRLDASESTAPFALMATQPMPKENVKIGGFPDLPSAKKAAKAYYIEHLKH